ncbi:hypothetical protein RQP46_007296 [Phenoliferia psychrophenolica]
MDVDTPASGSAAEATRGYKVVLRRIPFILSRNQCEWDSPNYFTSAFGGDFEESATRTIIIDRSPILFEFILEHLSGYAVIPLPPIPSMRPELAIKNLLLDAQYFGLSKLEEEIQREIMENYTKKPVKKADPEALRVLGYSRRIEFEDLASGAARLERDPSKWRDPEGNVVPLVGETLPPLIRLTNINLTFGWMNHVDHFGIMSRIAMLDGGKAIVPNSGADDGRPALRLGMETSLVEHNEANDHVGVPEPMLTLDGEFSHWDQFRAVLNHWHQRGPSAPEAADTPLARVLYRHLNFLDADNAFLAEFGLQQSCSFQLSAEEVWVKPVIGEMSLLPDGTVLLGGAGYVLVSAKMRSHQAMMKELLNITD